MTPLSLSVDYTSIAAEDRRVVRLVSGDKKLVLTPDQPSASIMLDDMPVTMMEGALYADHKAELPGGAAPQAEPPVDEGQPAE